MGLMDKVKAQAAQVAEKAQEGLKSGQAKIEEAQDRKKGDALLRDLGALVYAQRTGRAPEGADADISRLVAELQAQENEHQPVPMNAPAGAATPDPGGDFTLDNL